MAADGRGNCCGLKSAEITVAIAATSVHVLLVVRRVTA